MLAETALNNCKVIFLSRDIRKQVKILIKDFIIIPMCTMCVYVGEHARAPLGVRGHLCGVALFFHLYVASAG